MATSADTSIDTSAALRLPPPDRGWRHTFWVVVGALMFGAMLVAAAVWTAPALISDWQVRDAARPLSDARVREGKCSTHVVLSVCDVTIERRVAGGVATRDLNYVFTGLHFGDYSVRVLGDPARPDLVTTDLGLDRLWNRTITLLVGAGLLLAMTVLPLLALTRRRRTAA